MFGYSNSGQGRRSVIAELFKEVATNLVTCILLSLSYKIITIVGDCQ